MILRRLPQLVAGALLLGAGGMAWAQSAGQGSAPPADGGVPLQESKEALRRLQKERAQGQAGQTTGARDALPTIAAPDLENAAGRLPSMARDLRKEDEATRRKREAQRNWLVEGMLRLEGKKADGVATSLDEDSEESETIEANDPDFLLKTYLKEQRAAEEAKEKDAARSTSSAATVDPMTPFLREWLSGSPVEKTALAAVGVSGPGAAATSGANPVEFLGGSAAPTDGGGGGVPAFDSFDSRSAPRAASGRDNPFLQGLDLSLLPTLEQTGGNQPVGISQPAPPPATQPAPVVNVLPDPAPSRTGDRRPPPSALKENEKYFPQQRKF